MIGHSVLPGRFRQSRLLLCTTADAATTAVAATVAATAAAAATAASRALTKVYYLALPPGTACLLLSQ